MSTVPAGFAASRPLILIASPSADEHEMYADYFSAFGFRVATATRGDEAIERARSARPAVAVASAHLPGQDGIEVCRTLNTLGVPVILLASVPSYCTPACAAVLLRPALPDEVMAAIERVLSHRQ